MNATHGGALPSQTIRALMDSGCIMGADSVHVSPASLDLTVSDELYAITGLILPRQGEVIRDLFSVMGATRVDIHEPLMCGKLYIARLNETLALPTQVYGYCNPKSSTGRLDMHVRVLADGVPRYDSITPRGYKGELWVAIFPKSFGVRIHKGVALTQLRLFTRDTRFTELDLEIAMRQGLVWHPTEERQLSYGEILTNDQDGAVVLTALIEEGLSGYHCVAPKEAVIDIGRVGEYQPHDFFESITIENGSLRLLRDHFYILSGAERVRIPPTLASEMVPMDERSGDFRSHYAGFLDPGWGWGKNGEGHGRPFTLEVRPFEDLVIRKGQPIAKIRFERMSEEPDMHYDDKGAQVSHYLTQTGPRLGKQFVV
ncbi:MAG TPA: 2'-deoxycytidine 5'-triphosphate deaminase [Candidatus Paceibacterota bacterium]|nr:2'-deoxycytidine 5'-triphosphate deaminase [Candidatus Paceibacterota bacterium]